MAYKSVSIEKKIEAAKRVLAGEQITAVSRELGVDRNSVAIWIKRVMGALKTSLARKKKSR